MRIWTELGKIGSLGLDILCDTEDAEPLIKYEVLDLSPSRGGCEAATKCTVKIVVALAKGEC